MIKRKLFVAGMTAFASTTATGIAALASQGNANRNTFGTGAQNQYFAGQNFSNQTDGVFDKGMMNDNGFDRNDFSTDDNSEIGTANNGIAGQGFKSADNEMSGQGFDTANNEMGGQSFDTADNNSDEKPLLPRKSDEEAMKEGNPKPALPEGVSVEDTTSETEKETVGQGFKSADNEMSGQGFDTANSEKYGQRFDTANKEKEAQSFHKANNEMFGQGFDAANNETAGQSFDTSDNNSDEKPVLPRKSDEEAMKEGNPKPTLPMGVTVDDADVLSN